MIGFESYEPYNEGFLRDAVDSAGSAAKDAMKTLLDIDPDVVKGDFGKIKDETTAEGKIKAADKAVNEDILGAASKRIDDLDSDLKKNKSDRRSIVARSKNSVLMFPVYITQSLPYNAAHIIAKTFERVYASYVQTVLSHNPIISENEANDLLFLKKFHTNINESTDLELYNEFYTPIDELDEMMKESVFYREQVTPTMEVTFRLIPCKDAHLISEHARNQHDWLEGLSYLKEDAYTNNERKAQPAVRDNRDTTERETTEKRVALSEDDIKNMAKEEGGLSDHEVKLANSSMSDVIKEYRAKHPMVTPKQLQAVKDEKTAADKRYADAINNLKKNIKYGNLDGYEYSGGKYYRVDTTSKTKTTSSAGKRDQKAPDVIKAVDAPKLLHDADIKKINGMLPWTIEASFRIKGENGALDKDVHYVIGVKTNLHIIRTEDLAEDLNDLITGKMKSLQKVRYKTGEITFADYVFNKKGIKKDAAKSVNYNKKWLNSLKRLSEWEKIHGTLLDSPAQLINGGKDVPIPNGTLVLAQTDVTTMMSETGIDLSLTTNATRLARALFLISVCIVDPSEGTMRVLFPDSSSNWDVQSLASIDAELSKTDNSPLMRELNRIVNRA